MHKATILHCNFVVGACSFISESPRWLLSRGRKKDAVVILQKIAKINKKDFSIIAKDITVKTDTIQFLEFTKTMLKSKTLMVRLSIIALNWYVLNGICSLFRLLHKTHTHGYCQLIEAQCDPE
jgi:hypothetical protein